MDGCEKSETNTTTSIAFETNPLTKVGAIGHRNDIMKSKRMSVKDYQRMIWGRAVFGTEYEHHNVRMITSHRNAKRYYTWR